jgi:hypothetical protein
MLTKDQAATRAYRMRYSSLTLGILTAWVAAAISVSRKPLDLPKEFFIIESHNQPHLGLSSSALPRFGYMVATQQPNKAKGPDSFPGHLLDYVGC